MRIQFSRIYLELEVPGLQDIELEVPVLQYMELEVPVLQDIELGFSSPGYRTRFQFSRI